VVGDVVGDGVGDVAGDVAGDVTGLAVGDVVGDVVGDAVGLRHKFMRASKRCFTYARVSILPLLPACCSGDTCLLPRGCRCRQSTWS
jgi:hypothetical protein